MRVKFHGRWDNYSFLYSRNIHFSRGIKQQPQFRGKYGPKNVLWVSHVFEGITEVFMEEVTLEKDLQ